MRKILFNAVCFSLFSFSCNSDTKPATDNMNSLSQKNLAASHIVDKAFETGDISLIDSAVASDFVDYTDKGDMNRDSLKAMISMMHGASNNMKMETIKEFADDDYVFSLMHFSGTSDGAMMPAGPYDMRAMEVIKFRNGKAIEHWEYMEPAEMIKMMPPADTKKNLPDAGKKK